MELDMLVESMTKAEALKEMTEDVNAMIARIDGWEIKYSKQLKNKAIGYGSIIDTLTVKTKNHNEIIITLMKECTPNSKIAAINIGMVFRMGIRFVEPIRVSSSNSVDKAVIYTDHFCRRLKERTGISFMDAQREITRRGGIATISPYTAWREQGLPEGEWYAKDYLTNLALGTAHKWGYIFNTTIGTNESSAKQTEQIMRCKMKSEYIADQIYEENIIKLRKLQKLSKR